MNIFPIHKNPEKCVRLMCDQHVIKILTEAVEIYCSSLIGNEIYDKIPKDKKYKYVRSPWVEWAKIKENRHWLIHYIYNLNKEYEYRFKKKHKAYSIFEHVSTKMGEIPHEIKLKYPRDFLQLVDEESKCEDGIKAYRSYYKYKYKNFKIPMRWTGRSKPKFLNND